MAKKRLASKIKKRKPLILWVVLFLCAAFLLTLVYQSKTVSEKKQIASSTITYEGITPCADCTGIKTTLKINSSPSTYSLNLNYEGKNTSYTETGTWTLSNDSGRGIYTLSPSTSNGQKTMYQILNATQIRQLDGDGNPIPESMPFTLTKTQ